MNELLLSLTLRDGQNIGTIALICYRTKIGPSLIANDRGGHLQPLHLSKFVAECAVEIERDSNGFQSHEFGFCCRIEDSEVKLKDLFEECGLGGGTYYSDSTAHRSPVAPACRVGIGAGGRVRQGVAASRGG